MIELIWVIYCNSGLACHTFTLNGTKPLNDGCKWMWRYLNQINNPTVCMTCPSSQSWYMYFYRWHILAGGRLSTLLSTSISSFSQIPPPYLTLSGLPSARTIIFLILPKKLWSIRLYSHHTINLISYDSNNRPSFELRVIYPILSVSFYHDYQQF